MKRFLSLLLTAMMIFSCVSFTASAEETGLPETETPVVPAFRIFNGSTYSESPNAVVGSKVLLTVPADGAVYYNNGVEITTTAGMAEGTVAAAVNAGVNKYTAIAGGVTYGPLTIYGYAPVNSGTVIGTNFDGRIAADKRGVGTDSTLLEANPEGLTNLIDEAHPYAFKVGSTDTVVKTKFSSGMKSRSHYAAAVGFYVDGVLAEAVMEERPITPVEPPVEDPVAPVDDSTEPTDPPAVEPETPTTEWVEVVPAESFRIFMFQNSGNPYLGVYVGPKNHLYLRTYNQTGFGKDTGVVITPNVWHDLGIAVSWNIDTIASIYVDGQLVAKTSIKSAASQSAGTISDRLYHYPAMCAAGKGYIGDATAAPVFTQFPIVTSTSTGATTKFGANRNETINLPSASLVAEAEVNTVSVSANIPAELAGAEVKVLVNGAVANTMANGDKVVILSNTAIENAAVTAAIVDAEGNVLTGFLGEKLESAPVTMNIAVQGIEPLMSEVELYAVKGAGFANSPYAVAGNKVIVVPPSVVNFNESTMHIAYFSGETDVTASVVAGPYEGTVAVPVVAGSTYLTAKVLDTATGAVLAETNEITLYGQDLSEGTPLNAFSLKAANFTNVTDALTADLASEDAAVKAKAEKLLAGDRTVYQTKAVAANSSAELKSFVTGAAKEATNHSLAGYKDALEISYDFYLDEAFTTREGDSNFYMFGFNVEASAVLREFFGSSATLTRMGTYYKVGKDLTVTVGSVNTGAKVETGKWHHVTYYIDAHASRVDFYLDGVLISKAGVQGNGIVRDLDKQAIEVLAPFCGGSAGAYNDVAYFANATVNADREYSFAPTVYGKADDEANTLTITLRDIAPADATAYLYMNDAKFPTAIPFTSETFVIEGLSGYSNVYVAVEDENGEVAKSIFGDELKTFTFAMTDADTTDVVSNGVITDTGAKFTLIKKNIAEEDLAAISIITINAAGEITVTPYTFEEGVEYDLVEVAGEGLEKVFVWNLGDLRALDKAISK